MAFTDGYSKKVRADINTHSLLGIIHERAVNEQLKSYIQEIRDHVGNSRYRGGKRLLDLIRTAIREASELGDRDTVSRLEDLYGHSTGRILSDDLERKYQLFDTTRERNLRNVDLAVSNSYALTRALVADFVEKNPDATAADILQNLTELSKLSTEVVESREQGHYRVVRLSTESQIWLAEVIARRLEITDLLELTPDLLEEGRSWVPTKEGMSLMIEALHLQLRRKALAAIRDVVENPYSKESHIQGVLHGSYWLFGGSYVGEMARRRLTIGTEVDIPLLRPDGSLHVVELKLASVPVIRKYRTGGLIATSHVHKAVSQVMNYLQRFDERRCEIVKLHGLEVRRASGTVVIGHPMYQPEFSEREVAETLRTYNSHQSRISVITYKQLLDSAERALDLSGSDSVQT